jgi:hypothetical protein
MNIQSQSITHQNQSALKSVKHYSSGLEFLRALSAYGVVFIHGISGIPRDSYSLLLEHSFSSFCVPLFLTLSFYLTLKSLTKKSVSNKRFLIDRLKRIGLPFLSWSLVYISLRFVKSTFITPGDDSFIKIISDPIGIFSGSAGVQLYFLPMLFVGLALSLFLSRSLNNLKKWHLILLLTSSSILDIYIQDTNNSFAIGGMAFTNLANSLTIDLNYTPILRFVLVALAMLTRCLPYIAIAALLVKTETQNPDIYRKLSTVRPRLVLSAIIIILLYLAATATSYSAHIYTLVLPTLLLILGLCSSQQKFFGIEKTGSFTFGIYLVHSIFTDGFSALIPKFYPALTSLNLPTSLGIALFIFLLSLAITYSLSKFRLTSVLLLGNTQKN